MNEGNCLQGEKMSYGIENERSGLWDKDRGDRPNVSGTCFVLLEDDAAMGDVETVGIWDRDAGSAKLFAYPAPTANK